MGFVYCISDGRAYLDSNGIFKLTFKIGEAGDDVIGRIDKLRSQETFIDDRFTCHFIIETSDAFKLENMFHTHFKEDRVSGFRELFYAPLDSIKRYAREVCGDENDNVFVDYENLRDSANNPKNMANNLTDENGLIRKNTQFKGNTRGHLKERIDIITNIIESYQSEHGRAITVKELLNLKINIPTSKDKSRIYNRGDLRYDIKHSYFGTI